MYQTAGIGNQIDNWNDVTDTNNDTASLQFAFDPAKTRGVLANLTESSTELDCLLELLSADV